MPDVINLLREADPVPRNRWSETAEGRETRERAFDKPQSPRSRTTVTVLIAAVVVLAIVASVLVTTSSSRESTSARRAHLDWAHGKWTRIDSGLLANDWNIASVWTGSELVFVGTPNGPITTDGGAWDTRTGDWRALAPSALRIVQVDSVVWTGREVIVWGNRFPLEASAEGASYDPTTDTWRELPPAPLTPRRLAAVAWTGKELVILGGDTCLRLDTADCSARPEDLDGAAYDPVSDQWRVVPGPPHGAMLGAASSGSGVTALGAEQPDEVFGQRLALGADQWSTTSLRELPVALHDGQLINAGGGNMLAVGTSGGKPGFLNGAVFDRAGRFRRRVHSLPAPFACRATATAVPRGAVATCGDTITLMDPTRGTSTLLPDPPAHLGTGLVWTGKDLFVLSADPEHLLRFRPAR